MESFYLIATIRPRADKLGEAENEFRVLVAATQAEAGCELYELVVPAADFEGASHVDPDDWLMIEKWSSRPHWDAHMESAHVKRLGAVQDDFLREPTQIRIYSPR